MSRLGRHRGQRRARNRLEWFVAPETSPVCCADVIIPIQTANMVHLSVAKTMATFCDHFSDVCTISSTTTAPSSSTATDDSSFPPPDATGDSTASGGPATVTVTQAATTTTSGNAAPTARVGLAAGVLAVAGFVAMV